MFAQSWGHAHLFVVRKFSSLVPFPVFHVPIILNTQTYLMPEPLDWFKDNLQGTLLFSPRLTFPIDGWLKDPQYLRSWLLLVNTYYYHMTGGITIHQPAILGYHQGIRLLTHNHISSIYNPYIIHWVGHLARRFPVFCSRCSQVYFTSPSGQQLQTKARAVGKSPTWDRDHLLDINVSILQFFTTYTVIGIVVFQ